MKNYFLYPKDIQIKKKIVGNKNFDRLNLTFSHDLDFQYLDILETNELNDLIKKITINLTNFKKENSLIKAYPNLLKRVNKISNKKNKNSLLPKKNPLIMGILNITKDSFYDGGKYYNEKSALNHAEKLISDGADIIDIGGESTRPGSLPIKPEEEIKKVTPIIKKLSNNNILVSCDTRNSSTMKAALDSGAHIINDVSGLNYDNNTLNIIRKYKCLYILVHSQGIPATMQNNPIYKNVACDIYNFFIKKALILKKQSIDMKNIIIDPGIGFGKTTSHNFYILKNLSLYLDLGLPLLVGVSRKNFIKKFFNYGKSETLVPSISLAIDAYLKGANILRVHDVKETLNAINIFKAAN